MQIKKITEIIHQRLEETLKERQILTNRLNNLSEEDIDLNNYPSIRQKYLNKYYKDFKLRRIFPIPKAKLKKFVLEEEKKEIKSKLKNISKEREELEHLLEELPKEKDTLYPNRSFLANYILKSTDPKETIDTIINICRRIPSDNYAVIAQIERNIANVFTPDNQIKKDTDFETVKWLFSKLFSFFPDSQIMSSKLAEITKELARQTKKEVKRSDLIEAKDALNILTKYLKQGKIIATHPNIEEFTSLLNIAKVEETQKQALIKEMNQRIKKENQKKEDQSLLKKYLTKDEYTYLKEAYELSKQSSDELHQMIKEEIHQIILLCRYLKLAPVQTVFHEAYESIARHYDSIKIIINSITSFEKERNYFYLTDEKHKPYILRSILSEDVTNYESIYFFLRSINDLLPTSSIIYKEDTLEIRSLNNGKYTIYFKISGNDIIILDIEGITPKGPLNHLPQSIKEQITTIENKKDNPEFRQIHSTYERIISNTLDLDKTKPKTLQKER